jgi:glycosyltransferase involved in cell wall biosynthesis
MRILHVSTRLILGGSQENTVLSCEGQARDGHDVHLAFGPIYGPEGSLLERVNRFNAAIAPGGPTRPITTHVIPDLVREVSPLRDLRALRQIRELVERIRPHIVHTHSSKAGIVGRCAAWKSRLDWTSHPQNTDPRPPRPGVIHTIHGPPFMPLDGGPLNRLKRRINNTIYTLAERHAARRCDVIVSVADAMTTEFLRRGIGRPDQYVTVRSGMEIAPYLSPPHGDSRETSRGELGLQPTDFVIGTVARLAEHKGHDDLLDALADDLRSHPSWKLLWVGDGWWRERLLAKAKSLGLIVHELDNPGATTAPPGSPPVRAHIFLTGLVPPERVPAMIRAMDVLAHPSYREGLPRTVPQALLAGVCPLAYDADGTREVCRDMDTGRLVPVGNVTALREAARWLADHRAERTAMAERGRAWCTDRFSAQTMVAELDIVYRRALDRALHVSG